MRIAIIIGMILILESMVSAEGVPAGLTWPGWEVDGGEYYDAPGYPLAWLFDDNPSTAWVFHYRPDISHVTPTIPKEPHGVGTRIRLSRGSELWKRTPITIDAIGIINGYAKSRSAYYRNNRITRLRVLAYPFTGKKKSGKRSSRSRKHALCNSYRSHGWRLPRSRWRFSPSISGRMTTFAYPMFPYMITEKSYHGDLHDIWLPYRVVKSLIFPLTTS